MTDESTSAADDTATTDISTNAASFSRSLRSRLLADEPLCIELRAHEAGDGNLTSAGTAA